ncbi:N-acetylneuraminate synthase [Candidatus Woesearchaeota archaeon]|nr:N-acetylneuraminate synthase [Candidatus Woesearchaeota archaeon]
MSSSITVKIGDKVVGSDNPCFIIAEAGVNHDGSIEKAKKLIDAAVEAKADAVKFQTFKTDKILIKSLEKCRYQKVGDGEEGSYADMIRRLELDEEAHRELFNYATQKGIMFLSTPFDNESTDLLDRLGVKAFKIDSGNLNHPQHLKYIASKGKPIILSTGMATIGEIDEAVKAIYSEGNRQLILLHCTSNYPPSPSDVNLKAMKTLQYQFDVPVGYSDHTIGLPVTLAAVARGAVVVEKHFTLSHMSKGPDHLASLEPNELKQLVEGIRMISQALGSTKKEPVAAEKEVADNLRRSIVSLNDLNQGTKITKEMLAVKRPGTGIPSKYLDLIVGRIVKKDIPEDSLINWDQI